MMETEKLIIKPLTTDDIDHVFALTSDEDVAKYMRFGCHKTRAEAEALVAEYTTLPQMGFALVEKESQGFVGIFAFKKNLEVEHIEYSMTTFIDKKFWNKGYASEMLEGMIDYAKHSLHADALTAYIVSENIGSQSVVKKSNFTLVKKLKFDDLPGELYIFSKRLTDH